MGLVRFSVGSIVASLRDIHHDETSKQWPLHYLNKLENDTKATHDWAKDDTIFHLNQHTT